MIKIDPKSYDIDSFKYSVLISLHYYDIFFFWLRKNLKRIVQLKNNRYALLKPLKNKFMRLDKILKSLTDKELKEEILTRIYTNGLNDLNDRNDTNNSSDTNDTNDTNDWNDANDSNNSNETSDSNDTNDSDDANDTNDWSYANDSNNSNDINDSNDTNDSNDINYSNKYSSMGGVIFFVLSSLK